MTRSQAYYVHSTWGTEAGTVGPFTRRAKVEIQVCFSVSKYQKLVPSALAEALRSLEISEEEDLESAGDERGHGTEMSAERLEWRMRPSHGDDDGDVRFPGWHLELVRKYLPEDGNPGGQRRE